MTHRKFNWIIIIIFLLATSLQAQYSLLHTFSGGPSDGSAPYGSLIKSGTILYGMTLKGGSYNMGTIFKINSDGTGYSLLYEFTGVASDGQWPYGSLILNGSSLYGTVYYNGIFKINIDGTGFTLLHRFGGGTSDGNGALGSLITDGNKLFGMTAAGGAYGSGTIFKINIDGTGFAVLHSFSGFASDGGGPNGSLIISGAILYGLTQAGGVNNVGTIFKINTDGAGFALLHSFSTDTSNGRQPLGDLLLIDSTLYGMTYIGGAYGSGTIFKINTDGTGFALLHSFDGINGYYLYGSLIACESTLYGMASNGGAVGNGAIFKINIDGSGVALLHSFPSDALDGKSPFGSLIGSGSTLYGMTSEGGIPGRGVIFSQGVSQYFPEITVSGTVTLSGNPLANATMNGLPGNPMTNAQGQYTATVNYGWSGTATPMLAAYTFNPASRSYTNIATNQTGQDYSASAIIIPATITVTAPNGGESWTVGSSHDITWTSTNVANIKIEYSINSGSSYTTIIASTPNSNSYAWTVPNAVSTTCLVRVSDASNAAVNDVSNAVFSIVAVPTVTVTAPNAGESWTVGSTHNITWTSTNVANVKIEYSTNSGSSYTTIIPSTPNSNSYAWTVPNAVSTTCLVRVSDASNAAVNDVSNAVFSIVSEILPPRIALSKTSLAFGAVLGGASTLSQPVVVSNSGGGTLGWSASKNKTWLGVLPVSGTGDAILTVTVNASGLARGTYTGAVTITAPGATNSPQAVLVTMKVYRNGVSASPIGVFDTPTNGSTVRGSIAVTGWALDDIEVTKVEIRRKPVTGDLPGAKGPDGLIYVGEAMFVEGARPDVEAAKSSYPLSYRAGWGYMLLTYGLPAQGNGTFVLHAVASDKDGHTKELGTKTIVSDNAHNTKPFGAIDTPGQGGTVSGRSYVNFGWVLTPPPAMIPVDGSTIMLWIDGLQVGHPTYNQYRADIHDPYPDYLNADGAVGFTYIDTTAYTDGMHTISWNAMDDHGQGDGIGSRYFWVFNGSSGAGAAGLGTGMTRAQENAAKADPAGMAQDGLSPVYVRRGFRDAGTYEFMTPDVLGVRNYEIEEVERLVMALDSPDDLPSAGRDERGKRASARDSVELTGPSRWSGYLIVNDELRPLPVGSTLDPRRGVFYWQPGPGFLGTYQFVFVDGRDGKKKFVTLSVRPKSFLQRP